jgi:RIO-like serine/threonine protein kinase
MDPDRHAFRSQGRLKADLFGQVERGQLEPRDGGPSIDCVRRSIAACPWWTRPLARALLRREARALRELEGLSGLPQPLSSSRRHVLRTWIEGLPMQAARPTDVGYYRNARRLLTALHRRGVAHNDTAKEPNWLVTPSGDPALIDFQLAWISRRRSAWFRMLAREDLRHLAKHKRTYVPQALTPRELSLLATPSQASRLLRATVKPIYNLVTRRMLRWKDAEGEGTARS